MAATSDKTNFAQSLMHIIKGNLGTGILAMPATFSHCGLMYATIGLPVLCLIATYCVHLLVRSSQHLEGKMKWINIEYADLAKRSFKSGPQWIRPWSGVMCKFVDAALIISQLGICCVYIVFVVDNIEKILSTYGIEILQIYLFLAVLPILLALSYIRTLRRLSYASACANALQITGLAIIVQYLVRNLPSEPNITYTKPFSELALGFGAAMFAFEGISVVLPVYSRMKQPEQMGGLFGSINLSYSLLLVLYFAVGLFGYLKFGSASAGSITLNLPKEPLYDIVRAMFTLSLCLTYPLQFYVANEVIWNWAVSKLFLKTDAKNLSKENVLFEYFCRTALVLFTFILAITVPRLNLMMDFIGSISGTALSITLPAIIHIVAFWEDTSGYSKAFMVIVDVLIILVGVFASASGSYFSLIGILKSFHT